MSFTEKPLMTVANGGTSKNRTPIWMMRQAGRHLPEFRALRAKTGGFLDLCYAPEAAAEATMQPMRRYDIDAAIIFSDILVVPHGMGRNVDFIPGPKLEPLKQVSEIPDDSVTRMTAFLEPSYDAMKIVAEMLATDFPARALYGFCGAPFTIASYMIEGCSSKTHDGVRALAADDPQAFRALLDILIEANAVHLINQIDAGVDIVQIFDSWAGDLTPDECIAWSLEPTVRVARRVAQARPGVPIAVFPRGVGERVSLFEQSGAFNIVGLSQDADLRWTKTWSKVRAQGNVDPQTLVQGGTALLEAVDAVFDAHGGRPFVFNLGHGVVPETPIAHVEAMIARVRGHDRHV